MTKQQAVQLFEEKKIRSVWDDEQEKWYFSIADVVEVLTESTNPTDYIKKMKKRDSLLAKGWGQIVTPLSIQTAGGIQRVKGLKKENLRDNMTNTELILNMLAEAATTDLSKEQNPQSFEENAKVAHKGGNVARSARLELEKELGKSVVSPLNAKSYINQIKGASNEDDEQL